MGLFDSFRKKSESKKETSTQNDKSEQVDDFAKGMIKSADFFVSSSSDRFAGLDYSVKSLEVIDNVLEEASDFYDDMNEEQKNNVVNSVGSYIFEVARKNFGGRYFWYDKLNQPI